MKDEELLVAQLKNPDTQEQAFRNLMSLYKERLYWHIRKIVLSHDDADDVLEGAVRRRELPRGRRVVDIRRDGGVCRLSDLGVDKTGEYLAGCIGINREVIFFHHGQEGPSDSDTRVPAKNWLIISRMIL